MNFFSYTNIANRQFVDNFTLQLCFQTFYFSLSY